MKLKDYDIQNSYGFLFNYITNEIKQRLQIELKKHDVTPLQFAILINVYKRGPYLQKELANYTNGDEASTTRLVERLEKKGFLKRLPDKNDKRKKLVHATKLAENLLQTIIPYAIESNNETVSMLDENEKKALLKLLKKIATALEASLDQYEYGDAV